MSWKSNLKSIRKYRDGGRLNIDKDAKIVAKLQALSKGINIFINKIFIEKKILKTII
jgi:hypothetical protein